MVVEGLGHEDRQCSRPSGTTYTRISVITKDVRKPRIFTFTSAHQLANVVEWRKKLRCQDLCEKEHSCYDIIKMSHVTSIYLIQSYFVVGTENQPILSCAHKIL
ncbi:hypothetical protein KIN20_006012 [Parelaphostrongylus tenuis]|uniref:Uncharacterized protein n=1 Tax=Parelaphostrongylus tenuis TaxID=148309 RepID=A0AAD5QFK8_PARTN|nr:hypothetical protein KIN20_006012 [Parelaphostrongylus tenuis]